MKIDSKSSVSRLGGAAKSRSARRSGGDFLGKIDSVSPEYSPDPVAGSDPVSSVDALLSLQNIDTDLQERDWVRHWGSQILDNLSQLREGLLIGEIPPERLEKLISNLESRREVANKDVRQVMDEIELRARIEVAKLQYQNR